MTDIVERLRGHPGPDDSVTVQFRTMVAQRHEAADEIERLRRPGAQAVTTRDYREIRGRSENHRCADCDIGDEMATEIERLQAALKPFALNVKAESLSDALGHITREDLLRARAALESKPP